MIYACLNKGTAGLGISLAGNKDRSKMSVFICGLSPQGNAYRDGRFRVGDMCLEVNGKVLHDRHHLNVTSVIKSLPDSDVTFVLLRTDSGMESLAVRPLSQFPLEQYKDNPIERYKGKYKGLRELTILRGDQGLGLMIIEGKHQEAGTGVFVSDLQSGSCADVAGLQRGDMLLAVNGEDFVGVNYDTAAGVLKNAGGQIKMIVANPLTPTATARPAPEPSSESPAPAESTTAAAKPTSEVGEEKEKTAGASSPEKPKLPPKPPIAAKPAGLSPAHKPATTTAPSTTAAEAKSTASTIATTATTTTTNTTAATAGGKSNTRRPVASPRKKTGPAGAAEAGGGDAAPHPSSCDIVPGADTIIEITKDKDEDGKTMGLGLSIVGGSDTLLGAIFIHEVYEKGAAHKDGRLRPGDQILEVMHENLRNVSHSHALHALRQTPNRVRLVIHRYINAF